MKVWIEKDEWYPVYTIEYTNVGREVDIPEDKIEWIKRVYDEFEKIQDYLEEKDEEAYQQSRVQQPQKIYPEFITINCSMCGKIEQVPSKEVVRFLQSGLKYLCSQCGQTKQ